MLLETKCIKKMKTTVSSHKRKGRVVKTHTRSAKSNPTLVPKKETRKPVRVSERRGVRMIGAW
jgi:hypothetical protein